MKKLVMILVLALGMLPARAQLYSTNNGTISFFSETPAENIDATSKKVLAVMNTGTKEIAMKVTNLSFEFPNKLMEEHFNEKYMESDKYPVSTFKGKINENVDLSKEGTYNVTVTGKLMIHGVEKDRTINGTVTVKGGEINMRSEFRVAVKDHKIDIPTLVVTKIAEEILVKVDTTLRKK